MRAASLSVVLQIEAVGDCAPRQCHCTTKNTKFLVQAHQPTSFSICKRRVQLL